MSQNLSQSAAVAHVASEAACIVIGVDADGTLRPRIYRGGELNASWAAKPETWLAGSLPQMLSEAKVAAAEWDEHAARVARALARHKAPVA
jgi:hypothetical protein